MLKLKGDGRIYRFRVKTDDQYDGIAYRALFTSDARQWQAMSLPFDSFCANFRGKLVPEAPDLCPEQIRQIGFFWQINKKDTFCLDIAWIMSI